MQALHYEICDDEPMTDEELEDLLKNISSFTFQMREDINHGEMEYEKVQKETADKSKLLKLGIGVFRLNNIRSAFFQTPSFSKFYNEFLKCKSNIYLPQRLSKRINAFEKALLDIVLGKTQGIVRREEERIFATECNEVVEINFEFILNEVLQDCGKVIKEYGYVKREI